MAKTPNIKLTTTGREENDKLFVDFRDELAGTEATSNMMIIDEEFGLVKAELATSGEAVNDLGERISIAEGEIDVLEEEVSANVVRFDGIDTRLDGIDDRIDGVDDRIDNVDTRNDGIDNRIDGVDTRMNAFDGRLLNVETNGGSGGAAILEEIARVEDKLDLHTEALVTTLVGEHGIRIFAGQAQYWNGTEWKDFGGSGGGGGDVDAVRQELINHMESTVATIDGDHGLRIYEGKQEYFDGIEWKAVPTAEIENENFDVVIKNQTEFEELIASPTWLDAESVLFNGEYTNFTYDSILGEGILIPSTVTTIMGQNYPVINFTNIAPVGEKKTLFGYLIQPELADEKTLMGIDFIATNCNNVNILKNLTNVREVSVAANQARDLTGILGCRQMQDIRVNIQGVKSSGDGSETDINNIGVAESTDILNLIVNISLEGNLAVGGVGVLNSTFISNAKITATKTTIPILDSLVDMIFYGFKGSARITQAVVDIQKVEQMKGQAIGFDTCSVLSSCSAEIDLIVYGSNSLGIVNGFNQCQGLVNCEAGAKFSALSPDSVGIGFNKCQYLNGCFAAETPSSTRLFLDCMGLDPFTNEGILGEGETGQVLTKGLNGVEWADAQGGGVSGVFDIVIRTQDEFDLLIESPNWLEAKSVAFIGAGNPNGDFIKDKISGIVIPSTVKTIVGIGDPLIKITNFRYDNTQGSPTYQAGILGYFSKPTEAGYSLEGISLEGSIDSTYSNNRVTGFRNLPSAKNCNFSVNTVKEAIGFDNCSNLLNTKVDIILNAADYGYSVAYRDCSEIINSEIEMMFKGNANHEGILYDSVQNLVNFKGTLVREPHSEIFGTEKFTGLFRCNSIYNGEISLSVGGPIPGEIQGAIQCQNLNNIAISIEDQDAAAKVAGFEECSSLLGCTGLLTVTAETISAWIFVACQKLNGCGGIANLSTVSLFVDCDDIDYFSCTGALAPGTTGYVLTKTADGVEWAESQGGEIEFPTSSVVLGLNASGLNSNHVVVGGNALGSFNSVAIGVGAQALSQNSIAIGYGASLGTSSGSVAIGANSYAGDFIAISIGNNSSTGSQAVAIGGNAYANAFGIALGAGAKAPNSSSTAVGSSANASGASSTAIGYSANTAGAANTMQLGSSTSLSALKCRVALTTGSDIRDKIDIARIDSPFEFLKDINPITYVYNHREEYRLENEDWKYDKEAHAQGTKKHSRRRAGVSAQEVRAALETHFGTDNYADIVSSDIYDLLPEEVADEREEILTVNYQGFIPFLIEAINQLQERVNLLESQTNIINS